MFSELIILKSEFISTIKIFKRMAKLLFKSSLLMLYRWSIIVSFLIRELLADLKINFSIKTTLANNISENTGNFEVGVLAQDTSTMAIGAILLLLILIQRPRILISGLRRGVLARMCWKHFASPELVHWTPWGSSPGTREIARTRRWAQISQAH